jgi:hypothetical protein
MRGDVKAAERDFDRVLAHSENPELTHYRQRLLNNLGILLLERGKYNDARTMFYEAMGLGSVLDQLIVRGNLALVSLEESDFEQLMVRVDELENGNRILRADWPTVFARTMRGYRALVMRDSATVSECCSVVKRSLEDGAGAVVMDTSYAEVFVSRVLGAGSVSDGVAYCRSRRSVHEFRNRLGFLRLWLEEARLLRASAESVAVAAARAILDECERLGATALARQASSIIHQTVD